MGPDSTAGGGEPQREPAPADSAASPPASPIEGPDPSSLSDLDWSDLPPSVFEVPPPPGFAEARARAEGLVAQMTQTEKISLLQGIPGSYVGNVNGVPRLGIPSFALHDGPAGVAGGITDVTAFPAPLALAATWDRDLARRFGSALGKETRAKGIAVHLGPMMNLVRSPSAGRNFESFGEDPWLAAELSAAVIGGIQDEQVVATAKHFVANEQETNRTTATSEVDERTLHEIYHAPFEASVRAGVGAVMCSYNLIGGRYACENSEILGDLRGALGFTGWVMSDWGATHSTAEAANAGLDMEMPDGTFFSALGAAVDSGAVAPAQLDEMATRIVAALARIGVLDDPPAGTRDTPVRTEEHRLLTREMAAAATTLLKNEASALPLTTGMTRLAVIGEAAVRPIVVGGGSAQVVVGNLVPPLDALAERAGAGTEVVHADGGQDAVDAASLADAAIVFVGLPSSEGADHEIALPQSTNTLISSVAAANPRTVVVLETPGSVLMPWASEVSAIVEAWYGGEEMGPALARVLFGDTNPGGKLPVVFVQNAADLPFPGDLVVRYDEGLFVGHRLLDRDGREPLFPFGHGLSYTTFAYRGLTLTAGETERELRVGFELENTGSVAGSEVAQLYVGFPDGAGEPASVLRGFERVTLAPGEQKTVTLSLGPRALSVWDAAAHAWAVPSGTFRVDVGSSQRAIHLSNTVRVRGPAPSGGN